MGQLGQSGAAGDEATWLPGAPEWDDDGDITFSLPHSHSFARSFLRSFERIYFYAVSATKAFFAETAASDLEIVYIFSVLRQSVASVVDPKRVRRAGGGTEGGAGGGGGGIKVS